MPLLYEKAQDKGTTAALVPHPTALVASRQRSALISRRTSIGQKYDAWPQAAAEMVAWVNVVTAIRVPMARGPARPKQFLPSASNRSTPGRFQQGKCSAPSLGLCGRSGHTWPGRRPSGAASGLTARHLLPPGAHGNRTHCDDHRREAARLRSASSAAFEATFWGGVRPRLSGPQTRRDVANAIEPWARQPNGHSGECSIRYPSCSMVDVGFTVDAILAKAKNYAPGAFDKQNTCAVLIEPLLGALGLGYRRPRRRRPAIQGVRRDAPRLRAQGRRETSSICRGQGARVVA